MAVLLEFRDGKMTEHHEDDDYLDDAWNFAYTMNRIAWEWAKLPLLMMEAPKMADIHVLQNRQAGQSMKTLRQAGYEVGIRRYDNGTYDITAYCRETAHGSHERKRPVRFPVGWRTDGGDGGASA